MTKIIYYRKKCIGCGICYGLHPDQWRMSRKDGRANLIGAVEKREIQHLESKALPRRPLRSVEEACPVNAIKVVL